MSLLSGREGSYIFLKFFIISFYLLEGESPRGGSVVAGRGLTGGMADDGKRC